MNTKLKDFDNISFASLDEVHDFFSEQQKTDSWYRIYTNEIEAIPLENNRLNLLVEEGFKYECADGSVITTFEADVDEDDITSSMETTKMSVALSNGTKKVMYPLRYTAFGHIQDRSGVSGRSINSLKDKARAREMSPTTRCECLNYGLTLYNDYTLVLVRDGKVTALLSGDSQDYAKMPTTRLLHILETELDGEYAGYEFMSGETTHEITSIQYRINDHNLEDKLVTMLQSYGMLIDDVTVSVHFATSDVGLSAARLTPMLSYDGKSFIPFGRTLGVEHKGGDKAMTMFVDITDQFLASFKDNVDNITRMMNVRINSPEQCLRNVYNALKMKGYSAELRECCERIKAEHRDGCSAFDIYWYLNEMLFAYEDNRKQKGLSVSPLDRLKAQEIVIQVIFMDVAAFDE